MMSEHEALPDDPSSTPPESCDDSGSESTQADNGKPRSMRSMLRWLFWRALGMFGGSLLLLAVMVGASGWYTSRPAFCRSCHIMEPYYVSWESSSHKDVSCVKCHFPPGIGGKLRGKTLGLIQLAKYVTASEGPRPAAEIPDASCLQSGCHNTRLLSGAVEFHGIRFDHTPHLEKLRRGKQLRCTSCHSQIVQGEHMAVTTTTCFLCHFKEGLFDQGLGRCTRCHQIPKEEFDLGGNVTFSHELAYEKGVECANCHGDLIRGKGEVPKERSAVCHDRVEDLAKIDDHEFIHRKHVTDHKIDCLDCHLTIEHSLDLEKTLHSVANCAGCHPDHHREQVNMFKGIGGKLTPDEKLGGSMLITRVDCRSCHRVKNVSATGSVLWKASASRCTMCHEGAATDRVRAYQMGMSKSLKDLESTLDPIREALEDAELDAERVKALEGELEDVEGDLSFLRVGNGIHNIHYADTLTRAILDKIIYLCKELELPDPEVTLPEPSEDFN